MYIHMQFSYNITFHDLTTVYKEKQRHNFVRRAKLVKKNFCAIEGKSLSNCGYHYSIRITALEISLIAIKAPVRKRYCTIT